MACEVVGAHRLLDPVDVVRGDRGDTACRLGRIERLVVVDHEGNVGPDELAHRLGSGRVARDIAVAELDLDGAEAAVE
jgi:hypothetical protein